MKTSMPRQSINNRPVEGECHTQPGINHWIGIFKVRNDFLNGEPDDWKSLTIDYKGPFHSERGDYKNGEGLGRIIHIRKDSDKTKLIINVEGIGEPVFDKDD